jgi:hypothetical protein
MSINHRGPAQVGRVIALPSGGTKSASLFRVMDELEVVESGPILQLVSIGVSFLVSPVGVVTIEISNEHGRMGQNRKNIGTVPRLAGGFVNICDMVSADTDDITVWSRQGMSCFGNVVTNVRGSSVLCMQCTAHKIETNDGEAAGYVSIDMRLLEADDVNLFSVCNGTDDTSLGS